MRGARLPIREHRVYVPDAPSPTSGNRNCGWRVPARLTGTRGLAPGKHPIDRPQDAVTTLTGRFVVAERCERFGLKRAEQRDDLFGLEVVVVVDRWFGRRRRLCLA